MAGVEMSLMVLTGTEAIAHLAHTLPSLVIVDDGIAAQEWAAVVGLLQQATTPAIPLLLLGQGAAWSEAVQGAMAHAAGAAVMNAPHQSAIAPISLPPIVDTLTKPFQPWQLRDRIHLLLAVQQWQQQVEAQRRQLQQALSCYQQLGQRLQVLFQALSHDLRTPVLGMQMLLKNLLHRHTEECVPVSRAILERMLEGGDRQLQLLDTLLEICPEVNRSLACHPQSFDLRHLLDCVMADFKPLIEKNRATLVCDLPESLPLVYADPAQIRRVFEHLVSNALKHNSPGIHLKIAAQVTATGRSLCCRVEDDGKGIPSEQRHQMFELCKPGNGASRTHGLGVGLFLCQQILRAHGSEIHLESQPNQGTTFWFHLPIHGSL